MCDIVLGLLVWMRGMCLVGGVGGGVAAAEAGGGEDGAYLSTPAQRYKSVYYILNKCQLSLPAQQARTFCLPQCSIPWPCPLSGQTAKSPSLNKCRRSSLPFFPHLSSSSSNKWRSTGLPLLSLRSQAGHRSLRLRRHQASSNRLSCRPAASPSAAPALPCIPSWQVPYHPPCLSTAGKGTALCASQASLRATLIGAATCATSASLTTPSSSCTATSARLTAPSLLASPAGLTSALRAEPSPGMPYTYGPSLRTRRAAPCSPVSATTGKRCTATDSKHPVPLPSTGASSLIHYLPVPPAAHARVRSAWTANVARTRWLRAWKAGSSIEAAAP
jgi:hypothetical protein